MFGCQHCAVRLISALVLTVSFHAFPDGAVAWLAMRRRIAPHGPVQAHEHITFQTASSWNILGRPVQRFSPRKRKIFAQIPIFIFCCCNRPRPLSQCPSLCVMPLQDVLAGCLNLGHVFRICELMELRFRCWKQSSFRDSEFRLGMVYEGTFVCRAQIRLKAATNACHVIPGKSCDATTRSTALIMFPKRKSLVGRMRMPIPPNRVVGQRHIAPQTVQRREMPPPFFHFLSSHLGCLIIFKPRTISVALQRFHSQIKESFFYICCFAKPRNLRTMKPGLFVTCLTVFCSALASQSGLSEAETAANEFERRDDHLNKLFKRKGGGGGGGRGGGGRSSGTSSSRGGSSFSSSGRSGPSRNSYSPILSPIGSSSSGGS
jgi:uncharacterized membrane protein YgcG